LKEFRVNKSNCLLACLYGSSDRIIITTLAAKKSSQRLQGDTGEDPPEVRRSILWILRQGSDDSVEAIYQTRIDVRLPRSLKKDSVHDYRIYSANSVDAPNPLFQHHGVPGQVKMYEPPCYLQVDAFSASAA
jgi:hypothetical protein